MMGEVVTLKKNPQIFYLRSLISLNCHPVGCRSHRKQTLFSEFLHQDLKKFRDASALIAIPVPLLKSSAPGPLKPQDLLMNAEVARKLADLGLDRAFGVSVYTYTHEMVTPEVVWTGVLSMPYYKLSFPKGAQQNFNKILAIRKAALQTQQADFGKAALDYPIFQNVTKPVSPPSALMSLPLISSSPSLGT
ncbi:unnamed protein product [Nyctereutes procyonoides]|uniref:(raccoon dog) hypothetical protein n=1 Tax=Nyctereutes procyonoides TaxID=34880 RepID=A0A811Z0C9_NYCPR|nr:unnamed protein product [Nyctereutes procyonoides]